jgi:hypothetical protein
MSSTDAKIIEDARREAYAMPLDRVDVSQARLYQTNTTGPISSGCARKTRCITAPRANLAPIGR